MELEKGFLGVCNFVVKNVDFYGTISFVWDKNENKLAMKSHKQRKVRRMFLHLIGIFTFLQGIQIAYFWNQGDSLVNSYSMLMVSSWFFAVPACYVDVIETKRVITLFNALLDFEKHYKKVLQTKKAKASSTYGIYTKFLCKAMAITVHVMWFFMINVIINPCFPAYPGYWLSPQCREMLGFLPKNSWTNVTELVSRFAIAIPTFIIWLNIIAPTLILACLATIKGFCISSYIQSYSGELQTLKQPTNEKYKMAKMQMELRIMLVYFRETFSKRTLSGLAFGGVIGQSVLFLIPIEMFRSGKFYEQPFITIACLWAAIAYGVIYLALFGSIGRVYSASEYGTVKIRGNIRLLRDMWFRRFFRSCPLLRVFFGPFYIEPKTPINFENVVLNQTVTLLLLKK